MDALRLLTADHNRVRGLFSRFGEAKDGGDTAAMASLHEQIDRELDVHTTLEETVFYPWARGLSDDIARVVDEGVEEHHVVKILLEEIRDLSTGDEEWEAKMTVVIENVEHHASEEESEMFPQISSAASRDDLAQVGEDLEARKRDLGAPVLADKLDLTTDELRRLASEQGIPGRSSMDHDELAATVSPG
jgi:hemerythrin superfamily protein